VWPDAVFYGTTFQELNAEERGIWFSLLVMAALGERKEPGIIEMRKGIPYKTDVLADLLNCKVTTLRKALKRLVKVEKLAILPDKRLKIKNWDNYQTRYEKYYKGNQQAENLAGVCGEVPSPSPSLSVSKGGFDEQTFVQVFYESFRRKPSHALCHGPAVKVVAGGKVTFAQLLDLMRDYGGRDKKWDWLLADIEAGTAGKPRRRRGEAQSEERELWCGYCKERFKVTVYANRTARCPKCDNGLTDKSKGK
jgi:hypothetical protein